MELKENYNADEVETDQSYDVEREFVNLKVGERVRNVLMTDTRAKPNQYGLFVSVMLDSADGDGHYMFGVGMGDENNKIGIFAKNFRDTFLYKQDDTGYWKIRDRFNGKPLWFGKTAVTNGDRTYHKMDWGFEHTEETPATIQDKDGIDPEINYMDQKNTVGYYMQKAYNDGKNKITAASTLVDNLGINQDKAIGIAEKYYNDRAALIK